jgi:hypothetical protein
MRCVQRFDSCVESTQLSVGSDRRNTTGLDQRLAHNSEEVGLLFIRPDRSGLGLNQLQALASCQNSNLPPRLSPLR